MRRREAIRRLVVERTVRSQKELARLLRARGVAAAQPTLSRDIRELGLVKGPAGYSAPEAGLPTTLLAASASIAHRRLQTFERLVNDFVLSVEAAGTLVVLRTPPADAQPVALAIDAAALDGVIGTIAGDDTIFLAARSAEQAEDLALRFRKAIGARPAEGPTRFPRRRKPGRRA
ncbi:MAG TPA: arginine repressor [Thermoanaerobaculia bacterium]|nr:arginine repressor [Thermoanaerobaculia bacterium]